MDVVKFNWGKVFMWFLAFPTTIILIDFLLGNEELK
jgi:hypothetical protein